MNRQNTRNAALALVGLLALSIYILACTSFSPDDTKILYPAFDAASGAIGTAVYDRETKGTEMLFLPLTYQIKSNNTVLVPSLLRAEWLPNGREIVVAHCADEKSSDDHGVIDVALIPRGARQPLRIFRVPDVEEAGLAFLMPLCIVGDQVFLRVSGQEIARLDLRSGALAAHQIEETNNEVMLYPAPDGRNVFCLESANKAGTNSIWSRLNPADFNRTPLMRFTNEVPLESVLAYDQSGRTLALLSQGPKTNNLVVLRDGQQRFARSLDARGQDLYFGNAILNPDGNALWATFSRRKGTNMVSYGLMEIPFTDAPPHELTLISDATSHHDSDSVLYFQAGISHDGKTVAIPSTYLACADKEFKAADCALFLVDVNNPKWPVTKVPIPMPAKRPYLSH